MSNGQQDKHFIPNLRTFQIENRSPLKISLSKLEINRIFMPNVLHIDHEKSYNHEEHLQESSILPIDTISEYQRASSKGRNITDNLSLHTQIEQSSLSSPSSPISQMFPDSIINDKQTIKRIFNRTITTTSTHLSKFITLTPPLQNKTLKLINNDVRYYQIGSLFTSKSTFLMHQNRVIAAHATASNPFLSDTIFIILIATLIIIILLFCLGLFCLCRRTTKRNISPSFDGSSYAELNGHSFGIPIDNYQQRKSKDENHIPLINDLPSLTPMNQPRSINDQIPSSPTVALHHTARQKVQINNQKLKKKRAGFCCCNSKRSLSTTVNARTRI